jgi:uncharacterized membrane protein YccC
MADRFRQWIERAVKGDWAGVHFAANIFVATTLLWLVLRTCAGLNPIWAISSMVAASDPVVKQALKTFRGRIINSLLGCATGLVVLVVGGSSDWKLPLALALSALLSSYVVREQVMFRQAPITAAIVIASSLERHSKLTGLELGLRRVGEVLLGCVAGVLVSWLMSRLWPLPERSALSTASTKR